jgi:sialate O-acetylesterase
MKSTIVLRFFILIVFLAGFLTVSAEVKLPKIFSSNMVLQQGIQIPVWGWAAPGEKVSVSFKNLTINAKADKTGKWLVNLPAQEYGGPYTLVVKAKNTVTFDNVLVGEVWICSGQSNMEFRVDQGNNQAEEIKNANYPKIRLFTVPKRVAQLPEQDIESGEWVECSPETVKGFSAVGYFFGRELATELKVPIGLIHSSWGGTVAETWISPNSIDSDPDFKDKMIELQKYDVKTLVQQKLEKIKTALGGVIPTEDNGIKNGIALWAAPDFDDSAWKTIRTPSLWENQGYADVDGIAWYRKEITLPDNPGKNNLVLNLGKIDDDDITWLNGVEIGKTVGYNIDRVYTVDSKILKPGKNVLTIRVNDTGGGGGLYSMSNEVFMTLENKNIPLAGSWKFKITKASVSSSFMEPNSYPTLLFNGMINPLVPYGIKGAIWYQGESNADRAKQYQRVFPELITDWRKQWAEGDFPFLFVSLANYQRPVTQPAESDWAELREAQSKTLSLTNTGMALAIDIGEANDIHPKNKQDVGKRLALNAFKVAYKKDLVFSGPMFKTVEFKDGKAYISFNETGSGLMVKNKYGYINGFSIAGSDKKFRWAKASLADNKTIVVFSDEIKDPVAVRYGWANNPDDLNLYNKEGLPANPFRTDNWPGITK